MNNGNFLKVAVWVATKRKINILAAVKGKNIGEFMAGLVDPIWEAAKAEGLVNDAMLAMPEPIDAVQP